MADRLPVMATLDLTDPQGRGAKLELDEYGGRWAWRLMVPSTGEVCESTDPAVLVRYFAGISWPCPCEVCPRCGDSTHVDDPDRDHPEDGLASCSRCGHEWWAHVGPGDGTHPGDPAELAAFKAADDRAYRG